MAQKFDLAAMVGAKTPTSGPTWQEISLEELHEHPDNEIFPIDDRGVEELAASIELNGLQNPPIVTPHPDGRGYYIISGHRRVRAVRLLHQQNPGPTWAKVMCRVQKYKSDTFAALALLTANLQVRRNDHSWIYAAAKKYQNLIVKAATEEGVKIPRSTLSQSAIANAIGVKRSELQRQQYIHEHLIGAVTSRWPHLPVQTQNTIAHMPPERQLEFAKLFPDGEEVRNAVVEAYASSRGGAGWFERYAVDLRKARIRAREIEAAEKERKRLAREEKKRLEASGKKLRCRWSGGWKYPAECGGAKPLNCSEKCCEDCKERLFCERVCGCYEQRMKSDYYRGAISLAHRIRDARLAAGDDHRRDCETSGNIRLEELQTICELYDVSADYIIGRCEKMKPAAPAPAWKRITADDQPPFGEIVELVTWMDERWWRGRMRWEPSMYDAEQVQMWTECIPLPPEPEEGEK